MAANADTKRGMVKKISLVDIMQVKPDERNMKATHRQARQVLNVHKHLLRYKVQLGRQATGPKGRLGQTHALIVRKTGRLREATVSTLYDLPLAAKDQYICQGH